MKQIYKVMFKEATEVGVAYAAEGKELFSLPQAGRVEGWQPFLLELREGGFADYLPSNLGCRLCSEKLKNIFQEQAALDDELQWLELEVNQEGDRRFYFILHFPSPPDVLDKEKSIFAGAEFVVKPVVAAAAVGTHRIFSYPGGGELSLFVVDEVRRAIEASDCTGLELARAPVR